MLKDFFDKIFHLIGSYKKSISPEDTSKLEKKLSREDDKKSKVDDFIDRKMQSMQDSQGTSDFSGSSYNGPGNVDHEKRNSNMSQRNF